METSECLPQAEEEVEMARLTDVRIGVRVRESIVDVHWVNGRVEVVAEVEANWADRRMVAQAQASGMSEVVEAADALVPG